MVVTLLAFVFLSSGVFGQDPCTSYRSINDPHRSVGHKLDATDRLICDRGLSAGWYRFTSQAGGNMPEVCPDQLTCGTYAPIWLKGKHPSVAEGEVNREACIHAKYGVDKCCSEKLKIRVKNCGAYNVYYLVSAPACSMAYCAGTKKTCKQGTHSATGFEPGCKESYPKLTGHPVLKPPKIEGNTFSFPCEIPYPANSNVEFEVTWSFDHVVRTDIPKMIVKGNKRVAYLPSKYLEDNMQKTITCNVHSYFTSSPQRKSHAVESNGYWAGITVDPPRIELREGENKETEIRITSTVPILCNHQFRLNEDACGVDIEIDVQGTDFAQIVAADACIKRLTPGHWNPVTNNATIIHKVVATKDFRRDGDKKMAVKFRPVFSISPNIFHGVELPEIQIIAEDTDTQQCSGTGDPHLKGFDRKKSYHLYTVGEYVFYKSKTRPFEVHIRTWTCGKVSCICGVVAREGNDIISVDMCHDKKRPFPKVIVKSQNQLLQGTQIKRDKSGKKFTIYFPSGASLSVHAGRNYMNVFAQAPSDDFAATTGICGNFNGNDKDDYMAPNGTVVDTHTNNKPTTFFDTWRIEPGESLFDKVPAPDPAHEYNPKYCKCAKDKGVIDCTFAGNLDDPKRRANRDQDITNELNKKTRKRRSTTYHDYDTVQDTKYKYDYGIQFKPTDATWPTPSGWTEAKARALCSGVITNSTVGNACAAKKAVNPKEFVDDCVIDIKLTDDTDFAMDTIQSLEKACEEKILKDPKNYVKGPDGKDEPPKFITTDTCPNDCSMKGQCVKGTCMCNSDSDGADCSILKNLPPTIDKIQRGGICDTRSRPCHAIWVVADNVLNNNKLSCRVRDVTLRNGKKYISQRGYRVPAQFENFREVSCNLPPSQVRLGKLPAVGHMISVSNNGIKFSKELMLVIHDSLCMDCNNQGVCNQKAHTCLIDGRCFSHGAKHPVIPIKYCNTIKSTTAWSNGQATTTTTKIVAPKGGKAQWRWDIWTLHETGCTCHFDHTREDCACCDLGACQCSQQHMGQCTRCGQENNCGKNKPAPQNGVDAWTSRFSGCTCPFDPSRKDCACCQNRGCPCRILQRNQCVMCGHPSQCGKKPEVFGPHF